MTMNDSQKLCLTRNSWNVKIEPVPCDWNLTRFMCKKQMVSISRLIQMDLFLQKV